MGFGFPGQSAYFGYNQQQPMAYEDGGQGDLAGTATNIHGLEVTGPSLVTTEMTAGRSNEVSDAYISSALKFQHGCDYLYSFSTSTVSSKNVRASSAVGSWRWVAFLCLPRFPCPGKPFSPADPNYSE